jgi:hypothetical protein
MDSSGLTQPYATEKKGMAPRTALPTTFTMPSANVIMYAQWNGV